MIGTSRKAMKQIFVFLSVSLFLFSPAYGQTSASGSIVNIPVIHTWDYYTDYGETGHLTHSAGSETVMFGSDYPEVTFDPPLKHGDTLDFWGQSEYDYLVLVRDGISGRFLSINYEKDVPDNACSGCSYQSRSWLHLQNITMNESDTSFSFTLMGSQLLGHGFSLMTYFCRKTQSSNQSWFDTDSATGVNQNSEVTFTISKHDILAAGVATITGSPRLGMNPQPADSYLNVAFPEGFPHASLRVMDILGREALNVAVPIGLKSTRINVSTLPSGTYFLSTPSGSQLFLVRH